MDRDLGSRAEMEQTFDTGLENVFSEEPAEAASRAAQDAAPTSYTEWGGGASSDSEYNLEVVRRGGDHARRSSCRAACACDHRSGAAPDRAVSHRSGRRGRLSAGGPQPRRRAARRLAGRRRGRACGAAEIRSAGHLRAKPERMPRDPAARTRPLRSGDARAGRESRSAGAARCRFAAQDLRRRRRGSRRDDRRDPPARSEAGI